MPVLPPAVTALQELGLNLTDSRIYLSLLIESPSNGHQISRSAGVPSAKVYEGLARLQQQGLVAAAADGNGFVPLPLDDLLEKRSARLEAAGTTLRDSVTAGRHLESDVLWHGSGYEELMRRAQTVISEARSEVLLSVWPAEFELLLDQLVATAAAGAQLSVILFASPAECRRLVSRSGMPAERTHLFPHALLDTTRDRHANELVLVADGSTALLVNGANGIWRGVRTDNPAVTLTVTNYIRHDIYINKLYFDLGAGLEKRYGDNLAGLLDVRRGGISMD